MVKKSKAKKINFEFINPKKPLGAEGTSKVKRTHKGRTHGRK